MPTTLIEEMAQIDYVRDQNGESWTNRYFVSITGEAASDIEDDVVNSGVAPLYGTPHASKPVHVIRTWFTPLAHRTGIINVRYGKLQGSAQVVSGAQLFSDGEWEGITSTIITDSTTNDRNGTQMLITYTGVPYPGSILFNSADQIAEATVETYLDTYLFERAAWNWPRTHVNQYQNKVNDAAWSGFPEKTILARVQARRREEGGYAESWQFIHNPKTWDFEGRFIVQGILPQNATVGNGIELFEVQGEEDFSAIPNAGTPIVIPT